MNEYLHKLKISDPDGINFYLDKNGDVEIDSFKYVDFGEKITGSPMGDMYDIIILNSSATEMPERFFAILSEPVVYIERMIRDGFLGVVAKATTTSNHIMDIVFEEMSISTAEVINELKTTEE